MQERHDRDGSERGQYNKQGSMEEYHHQLYRRPQMTGQAREEEEEYVYISLIFKLLYDPLTLGGSIWASSSSPGVDNSLLMPHSISGGILSVGRKYVQLVKPC